MCLFTINKIKNNKLNIILDVVYNNRIIVIDKLYEYIYTDKIWMRDVT